METESKEIDSATESLVNITDHFNKEDGDLNTLDGIDCPICHNKGFYFTDDDNGVTQTFHQCECMKKRISMRIAKDSGLEKLLSLKLKDYKAEDEWQKAIKQLSYKYLESDNDNWFCLLGQSGAGKTHICSAICNNLIRKCHEVRYIVWNTLTSDIKESFKNNDGSILRKYQTIEVLYIDDLFKGSKSEYDVKNIAFDILNYRYNNKLKTIISSELTFEELNDIDSALAGRIKQMCKEYLVVIPRGIEKNYRFKG